MNKTKWMYKRKLVTALLMMAVVVGMIPAQKMRASEQ